MAGFKTVFRRIGGRIIPIRVAKGGLHPDELQKIMHKSRAMKSLTKEITSPDSRTRKFYGVFYKTAKAEAKLTGMKIAKRIAKLGKK